MNARVALPALLLALLATITVGPATRLTGGCPAAHAGAWSLDRGEYYSELQAGLWATRTTYDRDGNRIYIPGSAEIEQRSMTWRNEIGWKKRLNVLFGLTGVSVLHFESPFWPAETGLSDVELGLRYRIANGAQAMAVEAAWTGPAGYDRQQSHGLGDGRQQFTGLLHLGSALGSRGFLELAGGGSYRFHKLGTPDAAANADPRLTTNVYYNFAADAGLWFGKALLVGGRYRGKMMTTTSGEGGPANFHAVGPVFLTGDDQLEESLHLAGPLLLYRLDDRMDVAAGSWSTAAGKNAFHFDQFYVSIAFKQSKLKRNQGFLGGAEP